MIKKCFVLSGGGCRGFAHLGVVKALQEHNIYPSAISGTSAGAIAGAFIANGFTPDEVMEMFYNKFKLNPFALHGFRLGLISIKTIRDFLQKNLRVTRFEELSMPFYVTATNFIDGSQTVFTKGNIVDAVIASSSIPVVFPALLIDGVPYVDGGVSNNLPVEPFADNKTEVIAVYVDPTKPFNPKGSISETMDRAIHLSFRKTVNSSSAGCYMHIEPPELNKFGLFDIHKATDIFNIGYSYANEFISVKC
jgi:NTE family protein